MDEVTGQLVHGTGAQGLDVRFEGEAAVGSALRREWFSLAVAEMLHPDRGLFVSKDGGRTFQPNPHSQTTAGPDHLSYFALLGRIAGLAMYHREALDASWTTAFIKAAFGYEIAFEDLHSVDPDKHASMAKLLEMSAEDLLALYLTFVFDEDEAIVYEVVSKHRGSTELKPGGEDEQVTAANLCEYLQLYATRALVGSIHQQVAAFRDGLRVFVDDQICATLRTCCTVSEVQLLLCGIAHIDVSVAGLNPHTSPRRV